jgi:membrane-bound lytic murein transglycosylase C
MRVHHVAKCIVLIAAASLSASCETTKAVGSNIKTVYNGGQVDKEQLSSAIQNDSVVMESQMQQLKTKMAAALATLRSNVQKRWGQNDTKTADRTTYVKYTQGYKSRVITDFDKGQLTVETLDQADPQASLKNAIIAALLTSNDPGAVDLFSDKDVNIDPNRRPYLYGLVHDEQGKSISTRAQAEKFAQYLITQKLQSRTVTGDQGAQKSRFVIVAMVKN